MRHFLILASLAFVTGAVADEGDFDFKNQEATRALENYRNKLSEEQQIQRDAIEILKNETKAFEAKWRKELIAKLEAIRTKLRKDADSSEVNKIDAAIKALEKGVVSPTGEKTLQNKRNFTDVKNLKQQLVGKRMAFVVPLGVREIILHSNGKILFPKGGANINETRWEINKSGQVLFLHANGTASAIMEPIDIGDGRVRFCGPFIFGSNTYHAIQEIK